MRRSQGQVALEEPSVIFDKTQAVSGAHIAHYLVFPSLSLDSWRYRYAKRAIDIVLATAMGLVSLIPGLLIALLIRITSPYPVFYGEIRIGRKGVPFRIWKFRSMKPHTALRTSQAAHPESTVLQWRINKHHHDPRITPIGRFLRRWSLDELPQLFNVLRGEMSLIGPRPVVRTETRLYKDLLPYYLAATPGLSGLWQVSGRSDLDFEARASLDANYVENWSLRSDLSILFRTIPAVLKRVGAR